MNQIFGLPAHPLLVHIPIVLIPLLALMWASYVARPAWRAALSIPTAVIAAITFLGTLFAANSGESLQEKVNRSALVRAHAQMGDQLKTIGLLFCLAVLGTVLLENSDRRGWRRVRLPGQRRLLLLAFTVTIVMAGAATVWDVRAGHSGAKAVWTEADRLRSDSNHATPGPARAAPATANDSKS